MRSLRWRWLVALAFCFAAAVPGRAQTVSLLNGSFLSMRGLSLTVSNCTLILAGWQQASCASGNLVLQAVSGSRNAVTFQMGWNGLGNMAINNVAHVGADDLFQLSFNETVTTTGQGSGVLATTVTTIDPGKTNCWPLCGGDLIAHEWFSAAAGGGNLTAHLLTTPTVSLTLTKSNSFTIAETVTMLPSDARQFMDGFNPDTLNLGLVRQTFATAPEPTTIVLLLTGLSGLGFARWRFRGVDYSAAMRCGCPRLSM